jgi:hypothetical protein
VWSLPGTAFNLKNLLLRRAEVDVIFKLVLEDAGFVEHDFRLFYKYVIINVTDFRKLTILVSHLYSKISFFRISASSPHIVAQLHA